MSETTWIPMATWEKAILNKHGAEAREHLESYMDHMKSDEFFDEYLIEVPTGVGDRLEEDFIQDVLKTYEEALNVLLAKNADYGAKNISESPGGPLNGLRVRMHDKMARINNIIDNKTDPLNESLRDSFLDMANYSVIAMMVLDGFWPGGDLEARRSNQ